MPRQNPTTTAGCSVAPSPSYASQSRFPGEQSRVGQSQGPQTQYPYGQGKPTQYQPIQQSRVGQSQYAASHQKKYPYGLGQLTQHQPTQFPTTKLGQPTRQDHTHSRIQAVQHQYSQSDAQYQTPGPPDGFITKNGRQLPIRHNYPGIKNYTNPNPGPPDGHIIENGIDIPFWYNPPGIVDKEMSAAAQAEYDRVRRRIVNGHR